MRRSSRARPISDERELSIARTARARRRRQSIAGLGIGLSLVAIPISARVLLGVVVAEDVRLSLVLFVTIGGLMLLVVGLFLFILGNWRCPACDHRLETGKLFGPVCLRLCPSCGARLVVDWDECPTERDDEFPVHRYAEVERR